LPRPRVFSFYSFQRLLPSPEKGFSFLTIVSLSSLFVILLAYTPPAWSQLINLPQELVNQPVAGVSQAGNLDIGNIRLDGEVLFQVGAPSPTNPGNSSSASPIERRVKAITFRLEHIIKGGFDPKTLTVTAAILNNQTVIVASDADWGPQPILTVTDADVEIAAQTSINAVAQDWSTIIQQALMQAWEQRQPAYQRQQIPYILWGLLITLAGSVVILGLQKWRWARHLVIERQQRALEATGSEAPVPESSQFVRDRAGTGQPLSGLARLRLSLAQQASLNSLMQPILLAAQISLWFGGIAFLFSRFPQTRGFADWLLRLPLSLVAVPMAMTTAKQFADLMLQVWLRHYKRRVEEKGLTNNRLELRLRTLETVLQDLTRIIAVLLAVLLFFYVLKALHIGLIILAALAFLNQDMLKTYRQTYFILLEDQYLLGDIVSVEDINGNAIAGTVERMRLRATKLRNLDGELLTISHGNIVEVTNRSHGWSQANLEIHVAYSTDLEQAMALIEQVAQGMQQDPDWQANILEAPTILGVDAFGDNSIAIRLLIKTTPGQQWLVGREYRRRIKPALDQAGIDIPFPQRSIWFKNALPASSDGSNAIS
jgi:small conductance mechanosensitive channel